MGAGEFYRAAGEGGDEHQQESRFGRYNSLINNNEVFAAPRNGTDLKNTSSANTEFNNKDTSSFRYSPGAGGGVC